MRQLILFLFIVTSVDNAVAGRLSLMTGLARVALTPEVGGLPPNIGLTIFNMSNDLTQRPVAGERVAIVPLVASTGIREAIASDVSDPIQLFNGIRRDIPQNDERTTIRFSYENTVLDAHQLDHANLFRYLVLPFEVTDDEWEQYPLLFPQFRRALFVFQFPQGAEVWSDANPADAWWHPRYLRRAALRYLQEQFVDGSTACRGISVIEETNRAVLAEGSDDRTFPKIPVISFATPTGLWESENSESWNLRGLTKLSDAPPQVQEYLRRLYLFMFPPPRAQATRTFDTLALRHRLVRVFFEPKKIFSFLGDLGLAFMNSSNATGKKCICFSVPVEDVALCEARCQTIANASTTSTVMSKVLELLNPASARLRQLLRPTLRASSGFNNVVEVLQEMPVDRRVVSFSDIHRHSRHGRSYHYTAVDVQLSQSERARYPLLDASFRRAFFVFRFNEDAHIWARAKRAPIDMPVSVVEDEYGAETEEPSGEDWWSPQELRLAALRYVNQMVVEDDLEHLNELVAENRRTLGDANVPVLFFEAPDYLSDDTEPEWHLNRLLPIRRNPEAVNDLLQQILEFIYQAPASQ